MAVLYQQMQLLRSSTNFSKYIKNIGKVIGVVCSNLVTRKRRLIIYLVNQSGISDWPPDIGNFTDGFCIGAVKEIIDENRVRVSYMEPKEIFTAAKDDSGAGLIKKIFITLIEIAF